MELHPHRHEYRAIIIALFMGLSLISVALVLHYQRNGMIQSPGASQTKVSLDFTPIPVNKAKKVKQPVSSNIHFSVVSNQQGILTYTKGERITLRIIGSTEGVKISGYDVLLSGGKPGYDLVSVKSLLPEFTILKFMKEDHLTITAVLKPSVKVQQALDKTPIAEIVISPTKLGSLNLQIQSENGKESTKVITSGVLGGQEKLLAGDSDNLRLDIKQ